MEAYDTVRLACVACWASHELRGVTTLEAQAAASAVWDDVSEYARRLLAAYRGLDAAVVALGAHAACICDSGCACSRAWYDHAAAVLRSISLASEPPAEMVPALQTMFFFVCVRPALVPDDAELVGMLRSTDTAPPAKKLTKRALWDLWRMPIGEDSFTDFVAKLHKRPVSHLRKKLKKDTPPFAFP